MSGCRRICAVTGARADYGLLYWILREVDADPELELQLVVTGMHLSPEFGCTERQIAADGFRIARRLEILLSSDTPAGVAKAMGLALIGMADVLQELRPDWLVVLGDRFETLAVAAAAAVARVPIAHLHGGEVTEGAVDEGFRHAISKLAQLHFTATERCRRRVIQLGEQPGRVFNVGAPGLDGLARLPLLSREQLAAELGIAWQPRNLLVTFHPPTLGDPPPVQQYQALLEALAARPETGLIFTLPNADAGGRELIRLTERFVAARPGRAWCFAALGQLRYWSVMRQVDGVVGNSSSGIIEAPALRVGTVNIGDRQRGRERATSVIDCDPDAAAIGAAIDRLLSPEFSRQVAQADSPYGAGGASAAIVARLKNQPLDGLTRKSFHDLECA